MGYRILRNSKIFTTHRSGTQLKDGGWVVFCLVDFLQVLYYSTYMKQILGVIISCFIFLLFLPLFTFASAISVQSGDTVSIPSGTTIDETVIGTGQNVTIEGDINGDVVCAGQNLRIEGDINGDVICAGQTLRIEGNVDGDIRYAGQSLIISGVVERNVTFLGQELLIEDGGSVNGEITSAGESVRVLGTVGRNISGAMQNLEIGGVVNGKVAVEAQNVTLFDNASIQGDLSYRAPKEAAIAEGATVLGKIDYQQVERRDQEEAGEEIAKFFTVAGIIAEVISLISAILLALLLSFLFPRMITELVTSVKNNKLAAFGWGLVVLFLTPILAIFLLFTVVGIPLALFLGLLWILIIIIGKAIAGTYVGFEILSRQKRKNQKVSLPLAALIGVPILAIITWVPLIGWIISFVALCMGLGALFVYTRRFIGK